MNSFYISLNEYMKFIDINDLGKGTIKLDSNEIKAFIKGVNSLSESNVAIVNETVLLPIEHLSKLKNTKFSIYECEGNTNKIINIPVLRSKNILSHIKDVLGKKTLYVDNNYIKANILRKLRDKGIKKNMHDIDLDDLSEHVWIFEESKEGVDLRGILLEMYPVLKEDKYLTEAPGDEDEPEEDKSEEEETPEEDNSKEQSSSDTEEETPEEPEGEDDDSSLDSAEEPSEDSSMDNDEDNNTSDVGDEENTNRRTEDEVSTSAMVLLLKKYQKTYDNIESVLKNLRNVSISDSDVDFNSLNANISSLTTLKDSIYEYLKYRFKDNGYYKNREFLEKVHIYIKRCIENIDGILEVRE